MASKKKAAGTTPRKAVRKDKAAAQDAQAAKDAKKAKASGPTASDMNDEKQAINEKLAAEHVAEAEAAVRLREKFNAGRRNVMGPRTIDMTNEEEEAVNAFLADRRLDARKKAEKGGASKKRYLVNDNPGPVRIGGITYNVPPGRHELAPEFMEQYFPSTVTIDGLSGGMLGGRFRVESDPEPQPKGATKSAKKAASGSSKVQVGHGRQPANDFSTLQPISTHPEALSLAEADARNVKAGFGVR